MPREIDNEAISKAFDAKDNDSLAAHYEKCLQYQKHIDPAQGIRLILDKISPWT